MTDINAAQDLDDVGKEMTPASDVGVAIRNSVKHRMMRTGNDGSRSHNKTGARVIQTRKSKNLSQLDEHKDSLSESELALIARLRAQSGDLTRDEQNAVAAIRLRTLWVEFRKKNPDITQTIFAQEMLGGWSQGNFSQYLTGKAVIGQKALQLFCKAFDCQPGDIRYELRDYRPRVARFDENSFGTETNFVDAMAQIDVIAHSESSLKKRVSVQYLKEAVRGIYAANSKQSLMLAEANQRHENALSAIAHLINLLGENVADDKVQEIAAKYGLDLPYCAA